MFAASLFSTIGFSDKSHAFRSNSVLCRLPVLQILKEVVEAVRAGSICWIDSGSASMSRNDKEGTYDLPDGYIIILGTVLRRGYYFTAAPSSIEYVPLSAVAALLWTNDVALFVLCRMSVMSGSQVVT